MKVILLAGGFGTRLAEYTQTIPKPMVEIGGEPILNHIMRIFKSYNFNEFIIAAGYKKEVITDYYKDSKEFKKVYNNERSKLSIQRFKGLGEMNPEELWNTTLNPEKRNLLQVQYSKNLEKDQNIIHTLMGNDVALRKDFIVSNAINVSNLDI